MQLASSRPGPSECAELRWKASHLLKVKGAVQDTLSDVSKLGALFKTTCAHAATLSKLAEEGGGSTGLSALSTDLIDIVAYLEVQVHQVFLGPLAAFAHRIESALLLSHSYDSQSDELDAAELKYLALSSDTSIEARAHADHDLTDRRAEVALQYFDVATALDKTYASLQCVPHQAYAALLQSCQAALTSAFSPALADLIEEAALQEASLLEKMEGAVQMRATMPQPRLRDGETLCEGWLQKGSFNLAHDMAAMKEKYNRLKPWNKSVPLRQRPA